MGNFLIKGIPREVYDKLTKIAKEKEISRGKLALQIIMRMVDEEEERGKRRKRIKDLRGRGIKFEEDL